MQVAREGMEPVAKKTRTERLEELKDQIADPATPLYRVKELEQQLKILEKLESKR
jgi:hypothetical protein